ncbi:DUF3488 domain-containing protein [Amycolatopsis thermophila]|uniref:4-amino-4-deoxy-L-arabinose transferase n=1 Tax=Amycolatopsis thermophila TaxID=206084 RepID=A0ABU0ESP3_9PSEU|nr:hypothetical protein [Amycolatopsis thermophila]MDQ0377991.1 hypothetical protein [Amycolatopsis thermophila]
MTQVLHISDEVDRTPGPRRGVRRDPAFWLTGLLAAVVGAAFVLSGLGWNQGKLIAPLDDVYIHLQYGRQLGLGHFFQFNTGDDVSAGASSLLYALVLGAAWVLGFQGTFFLAFAVGFGVLCFALTAGLVTVLGGRLVSRPVGVWSGVLVAVSGPLAWGSASGMEVGLVALLVVATLLAFVTEQPWARFRWTPVLGALLALARTEGLILAVALVFAALWTLWVDRRVAGARRTVLRALWTLLPVAVGAAQLLFYKIATGTATANGIQSKSFLHDRPVFWLSEFADRTLANVRAFVGNFLGFEAQDYAFPGALLVFAAGMVYVFLTRRTWRPMLYAVAAGLLLILVSVSTLNTALVHELRYVQPFLPVFVLFVVTGVYGLSRLARQTRVRRIGLHGALVVVLVLTLVELPGWSIRFGRATAAIRDTDVSVAQWIRGNLPPGATVAVKDVGAVAYFGEHRVLDLIGLGTNGFAAPANNGTGSLYEALKHLPAAQRPGYFAVYDPWPGPSMEPLKDVGVLKTPAEMSFDVQAAPDLGGRLIVPFRRMNVYRADWSLAGSGDEQAVPGELRDYVNVGDLTSEGDHGYQPVLAQVGTQPWTSLGRVGDVVDSSRSIVGGEAFTAHNLVPGRPLTITSRTAMHGTVFDMRVLVNGAEAGTWIRDERDGVWSTYTYTIPGELITSGSVRIEVQQPRPLLNPYPDYTSYGYWLSQ